MFTGLITDIGYLRSICDKGHLRFVIDSQICRYDKVVGTSIACAGVCLTVVEYSGDWFACEVSPETRSCTTLGLWQPGIAINLERSLKVGDELGGHLVLGHVDAVVGIVSREMDGTSIQFQIDTPEELMRFIVPKGSVTLDGVSLTVNKVEETSFNVNIIPHTAVHTTFGSVQVGDKINLEIDMLARYVARLS